MRLTDSLTYGKIGRANCSIAAMTNWDNPLDPFEVNLWFFKHDELKHLSNRWQDKSIWDSVSNGEWTRTRLKFIMPKLSNRWNADASEGYSPLHRFAFKVVVERKQICSKIVGPSTKSKYFRVIDSELVPWGNVWKRSYVEDVKKILKWGAGISWACF